MIDNQSEAQKAKDADFAKKIQAETEALSRSLWPHGAGLVVVASVVTQHSAVSSGHMGVPAEITATNIVMALHALRHCLDEVYSEEHPAVIEKMWRAMVDAAGKVEPHVILKQVQKPLNPTAPQDPRQN